MITTVPLTSAEREKRIWELAFQLCQTNNGAEDGVEDYRRRAEEIIDEEIAASLIGEDKLLPEEPSTTNDNRPREWEIEWRMRKCGAAPSRCRGAS